MTSVSAGIFIVGAKRTPFCKYGGLFRELPASLAFAAAAKNAMLSANIDAKQIENTVVGNAYYLSQCDGGKTPRYCGLLSGVPVDRPALGVSKACGTGLQAIVNASIDILTGISSVSLTGGTEIMSSLPLLVRGVRFGATLGSSYKLEDHIQRQIQDSYCNLTRQAMAEGISKKYAIKRDAVDDYTLSSHQKWLKAHKENVFKEEMASVTVNLKGKEILVEEDQLLHEYVVKQDLDPLSLLENDCIVTEFNSSAPADGAVALILANDEATKRYGLRPLARIAGWATVGVHPTETGLGAAAAVRLVLKSCRKTMEDIDLYEINETFAAETLTTIKELNVDTSKVNVHGGALAAGHPVAATGARMAAHLAYQMSGSDKRAIAASSCWGGQGVAIILESV